MGSDQIQMRGGKFKEYYILNSGLVSPVSYVLSLILAVGAALLPGDKINFGVTIIIIWAVCMEDIIRICSKTLYQKEAYFYQSFPVTPFQTVLAKTLVCTQLLQTAPLAFSVTKLVTTGELYGLEQGGFMAIILGFIGLEAFCFLVVGIVLEGLGFGNYSFRDRKKGRPGIVASIVDMGVQFALLFWIMQQMFKVMDNLFFGAITVGILVLCSVLCVRTNSMRLEKDYSL